MFDGREGVVELRLNDRIQFAVVAMVWEGRMGVKLDCWAFLPHPHSLLLHAPLLRPRYFLVVVGGLHRLAPDRLGATWGG